MLLSETLSDILIELKDLNRRTAHKEWVSISKAVDRRSERPGRGRGG